MTRSLAHLATCAALVAAIPAVARAGGPDAGTPSPAPAPAPAPAPGSSAPAPDATTPAPAPSPADVHVAAAHDAYTHGDYARARDELLVAYQIEPRPDLLFALGQAEFNLGHYQQAIDYYERFTATNPAPEQAALAQQAIGAARIRLQTPPPPPSPPPPRPRPPRPPPHRAWDHVDLALAVGGGATILAGAGLVTAGVVMSDNSSGTLHSYDRRVHDARIARTTGIGAAIAGAAVLTSAFLRWRFHLVETTVRVEASPGQVGVSLEHSL